MILKLLLTSLIYNIILNINIFSIHVFIKLKILINSFIGILFFKQIRNKIKLPIR